jgi:uncharacterized protein Yka (UPF0111/DUF47 family)
MSEYDGEIRIKASIDAEKIDKELQMLSSKLERQSEAVNRQSIAVQKLRQSYANLASGVNKTPEELGIIRQLRELDKQIDVLESKIHSKNFANLPDISQKNMLKEFDELTEKTIKLREELEKTRLNPESTQSLQRLSQEIENAESKSKRLTNEMRQTESALASMGNQKTDNFIRKIEDARDAVRKMGVQTSETGEKSKGVFQGLGEAVTGFGGRVMRLAGAAFAFNIISAGFRQIREHMGNLISQDNQLMSSLNQVKANLLTAFVPIWQAVLPALQALGDAISWVTQHIAAFVSMLFGKSVQQSQAAAKSYSATANALEKQAKGYEKVGESAKKAAGELASFDKIEVLRQKDSNTGSGSGGGGSIGGAGAKIPKILGQFQRYRHFHN